MSVAPLNIGIESISFKLKSILFSKGLVGSFLIIEFLKSVKLSIVYQDMDDLPASNLFLYFLYISSRLGLFFILTQIRVARSITVPESSKIGRASCRERGLI